MNKIRLIAIDLDGTLVRTDQTISAHTIDVAIEAQEQGMKAAIVSGRPTFGAAPAAEALRLQEHGGYLVSYNGAEIYDCSTGRTLFANTLGDSVKPIIYDIAKEKGLAVMTYIGKEVVTEHAYKDNEYIRYSSMRNKMPIRTVDHFLEDTQAPIVKCIIVGEPERLVAIEGVLNERLNGHADAYRSEPFFLEIVPHGIDKASGLAQLLSVTGISRSEVMALGDGYNDIPMIEYAGYGVAMGNAQEAVKAKAQLVTLSNNEDGVAEAIERYVLNRP